MNFSVYVLDIEGTTTPIEFVTKTLFPFARAQLGQFLENPDDQLASDIELLKAEHQEDLRSGDRPPPIDPSVGLSFRSYLEWLMDRDRKSTALKSIQGRIWQRGYESGRLRGEIFDDVLPAIKRWTARGAQVCIYSSGSILAQKLIFGYSDKGDVTPYITAYFDTNIGPKRSPQSFAKIASALAQAPNDCLFLSDVLAEVQAASAAGFAACLVDRSLKGSDWPRFVASFEAVP